MKSNSQNVSSQEKDKPLNTKQKWQTICIIVSIVLLIFGLIFGIYSFFTLLVTGFISMIIIVGLLFCLIRVTIRCMLFPGSIKLMQRSAEYSFMINRAKIMHQKLQNLNGVVECIESQNTFLLMDYSGQDLQQIYERISTMVNSYEKLGEKKSVSNYQSAFQEKIKHVQNQCEKAIISADGNLFTLWQMLHNTEYLTNIKNNGQVAHFQSKSQVNDLKAILMETMDCLEEIYSNENLSLKQKWIKWFKNDSFGSLEYFKAELQTTYKTKSIEIKTKNNTNLDCLLIYGYKITKDDKQKTTEDCIFLSEGTPTIIFSNPNAGFYEFSRYSNEWVDFYWRKGINVLIYNYRGYGMSGGTPSPQAVFSDGEMIVDYLRENEKVGLIGAHGQSLGGIVACHIAAHKNLDFLCADRTFSCVSDVAYYSMPQFFKQIVRLLTTYDVWSPSNYSKANCYKILAYDPKDSIINYMSSLKNGVSKQIAQNLFLKYDSNKLYHQEKNENMFNNMKGYCMKTWNKDTTVSQVTSIWLAENDQKELYGAFKRITNIIRFTLDKKHNSIEKDANNKQDKSVTNQNGNNGSKSALPTKQKSGGFMQKQSHSDLNSTLDYSNIINGSFLIDSIKDEESKSQISSSVVNGCPSSLQEGGNSSENNYCASSNESRDISEYHDLESQNKHLPPHSPKNSNDANSSLSHPHPIKKSFAPDENSNLGYTTLITEQYKTSKEFQKFMKSIFTILDSFDAGGLSLLDVFYLYSPKYSFQTFQLFILNLNIWGSYLPLSSIIRKNMTGSLPKKYALAKIRETVRKLENLSKNNQEIPGIPDEILSHIIADIHIIINKFKILKDKLQVHQITQSSDKLFEMINQNKELQVLNEGDSKSSCSQDPSIQNGNPYSLSSGQNTPQKLKRDAEGEIKAYQNLKEESQPSQLIEQIDINKIIGNLLPLQCGHNGYYSNFEVQLFEFHLKNSGFLKS